MIEEFNDVLLDKCKEIKKYVKTFEIDEFIDIYSGELNATLIMQDVYLSNKKNPDDKIQFDNGKELYDDISVNNYDDYVVDLIVSEYDQIDDILITAIDFIDCVSYNNKKDIIKKIVSDFIRDNEEFVTDNEDDENYDLVELLKGKDDDELVMLYDDDEEIKETVTYNYCCEIFEIYQDNKDKIINEDIDYVSINTMARDNIYGIIDKFIFKFGENVYKIINFYLHLPADNSNIKSYEIYVLLHDYFKTCAKKVSTLDKDDILYFNYMKNNDIKDIFMLFKNDEKFSKNVINTFIDNYLYLDEDYFNKNISSENQKILTKNFYPITVLDKII